MNQSMQMKQGIQSECGECKAEDRLLIHNFRHGGTTYRLCTNCFLNNHKGHFCPFCFHVYDEPLSPHERVTCFKCSSIAHLSCSNSVSSSSLLCPSCSSPSFAFFNGPKDSATEEKSALALVAAAKIAAASLSRAAEIARLVAERKMEEASVAKRKAKEALERLALVVDKEKEKKNKKRARNTNGNGNGKRNCQTEDFMFSGGESNGGAVWGFVQ